MTFNLEPVKRDKLGRNISDYSIRDFYEKISEELLESHTEAVLGHHFSEPFELLHVMTACATRITVLNLCDEELAELQQCVIERNRGRGYFTEAQHENH